MQAPLLRSPLSTLNTVASASPRTANTKADFVVISKSPLVATETAGNRSRICSITSWFYFFVRKKRREKILSAPSFFVRKKRREKILGAPSLFCSKETAGENTHFFFNFFIGN
jgi:hypothetical protein